MGNKRLQDSVEIIQASAALLAALIVLAPPRAMSQSTNEAVTNTPISKPNVSVFFGERKAMSAEVLRTEAKKALKAKGHEVDDSYWCTIHVQVDGKQRGCSVSFYKGFNQMYYTVEFNSKGAVSNVDAFIATEGGMGRSERSPKIPKGAVRVNP